MLSPEHTGDTTVKLRELLLLYSHWNHYQGESAFGHSVLPLNVSAPSLVPWVGISLPTRIVQTPVPKSSHLSFIPPGLGYELSPLLLRNNELGRGERQYWGQAGEDLTQVRVGRSIG